jgi:hypothetical protein
MNGLTATVDVCSYTLAPKLFVELRQTLEWADAKAMKEEYDRLILELLGPKTEADSTAKVCMSVARV